MPLTMANIGEANTIKRVSGNDETKRFLANLGFVPGAEVIVLSAIGGNVIVNIKDSRVAVNADMARHIMDMGITKGSELFIRKVAPLGDPVEITVRGYELTVRKADAQCVEVK